MFANIRTALALPPGPTQEIRCKFSDPDKPSKRGQRQRDHILLALKELSCGTTSRRRQLTPSVLQIQFYSDHRPMDTPALHPEVSHRSPGQPLTTWEGYAPKLPGSLPGKTKIFLSSLERPYLLWTTPILTFNRYWVAVFLGLELAGRDSHHSPRSTAEFKNGWSYSSTPTYAFSYKFTFTFIWPRQISKQNYWKHTCSEQLASTVCGFDRLKQAELIQQQHAIKCRYRGEIPGKYRRSQELRDMWRLSVLGLICRSSCEVTVYTVSAELRYFNTGDGQLEFVLISRL